MSDERLDALEKRVAMLEEYVNGKFEEVWMREHKGVAIAHPDTIELIRDIQGANEGLYCRSCLKCTYELHPVERQGFINHVYTGQCTHCGRSCALPGTAAMHF